MPDGKWLQKLDSNQRPQGYEPCELPLLYSAKSLPFPAVENKQCQSVEQKKGKDVRKQANYRKFRSQAFRLLPVISSYTIPAENKRDKTGAFGGNFIKLR